MGMTRSEMDRALNEHFNYEATDNIDGVLSTLAADATHDIVGWPSGPTLGRENARPFYEALFADLAESSVTPGKRLYGDNFIVDDSVAKFKAVGRPFGLEGRGVLWRRACCTSSSLRTTVRFSVKMCGSIWRR